MGMSPSPVELSPKLVSLALTMVLVCIGPQYHSHQFTVRTVHIRTFIGNIEWDRIISWENLS